MDVTKAKAQEYWNTYYDQSLVKITEFIESSETWITDNPLLESLFSKFIDKITINNSLTANLDEEAIKAIIDSTSHLKLQHTIYIIQTLDNSIPGTAALILDHAEKNQETNTDCKFILQRNLILEKLLLMKNIFPHEHLQKINVILEKKDD